MPVIGYVIRYPETIYDETLKSFVPTGQIEYYCKSSAWNVVRTDVRNAKVFPNKRSYTQGLYWVDDGPNVEVVEVTSINITLGKKVN